MITKYDKMRSKENFPFVSAKILLDGVAGHIFPWYLFLPPLAPWIFLHVDNK